MPVPLKSRPRIISVYNHTLHRITQSHKYHANMSQTAYQYQYFNVSFPQEYVAVVEINRPEKLNAFIEV